MSDTCVYQHRNNDSGQIFYIGIGNIKRPYQKAGRSKYWHKIVNKYGYSVEILLSNRSWEEACEWESFFISLHGRKDLTKGNLVNMTNGGDGGNTRQGKKHSEETKEKMSASASGKISHFKGKKRWPDGRPEETKEKISKSSKGKIHPNETKEKMSKTHKKLGTGKWNKGRKHTDAQKIKISESNKVRWKKLKESKLIIEF